MDNLEPMGRYHLLTQSVIPRPIAWVLTDNGEGEGDNKYNLAPFSFFNVVSSNPPLLVLGINKQKINGETKDTLQNLITNKKATIHITCEDNLEAMVDSSVELPHGKSELVRPKSKITLCEHKNNLPHIKESPIAFFCELDHVHEIDGGTTTIVFCRINETFIDDNVVSINDNNPNHIKIDPLKINPITRLGLSNYHKLDNIFTIERPTE